MSAPPCAATEAELVTVQWSRLMDDADLSREIEQVRFDAFYEPPSRSSLMLDVGAWGLSRHLDACAGIWA